MTLADLKPGQTGRIKEIAAAGPMRNRLLDLGFRRGERIKLIRTAPLSDPLEFCLNGGHISLRRVDAAKIEVGSVRHGG